MKGIYYNQVKTNGLIGCFGMLTLTPVRHQITFLEGKSSTCFSSRERAKKNQEKRGKKRGVELLTMSILQGFGGWRGI